jgi:hypothetical protein
MSKYSMVYIMLIALVLMALFGCATPAGEAASIAESNECAVKSVRVSKHSATIECYEGQR